MPRGKLNERYVQESAVTWLAAQCRERADVQSVVRKTETRVRSATKLGRGRADGLVAASLSDGNIHVASIEAKSSRTLFNVKHRYQNRKWLLHSAAIGLLGLLCSMAIGRLIGDWFFLWILPVIVFLITAIIYLRVTREHKRYQVIDVVRQVQRYPANEQWIALSSDAYNKLGTNLQQKLRSRCQQDGIGLMRVSSSNRVNCLEAAICKPIPSNIPDFLVCYDREGSIRRELLLAMQPDCAVGVNAPV